MVLAGDRDRDQAVAALRENFLRGRLTLDELSARTEVVLHARSLKELRGALAGLPRSLPFAQTAVRGGLAVLLTGVWLLFSFALLVVLGLMALIHGATAPELGAFLLVWLVPTFLLARLWRGVLPRSPAARAGPPTDGALTSSEVSTPHGPARVHLHPVDRPKGALILGHGAGGGVTARDLVTVTAAANEESISVALVEQPYRVAGRRTPAPANQLDAAWTAVVEHLTGADLRGLPPIVGGRSSGARVACRTAEATGAAGVLCLAFPLQPARRAGAAPAPNRLPELDAVTVPTLVVQGTRDPFGMPAGRGESNRGADRRRPPAAERPAGSGRGGSPLAARRRRQAAGLNLRSGPAASQPSVRLLPSADAEHQAARIAHARSPALRSDVRPPRDRRHLVCAAAVARRARLCPRSSTPCTPRRTPSAGCSRRTS